MPNLKNVHISISVNGSFSLLLSLHYSKGFASLILTELFPCLPVINGTTEQHQMTSSSSTTYNNQEATIQMLSNAHIEHERNNKTTSNKIK